MNVIIVMKHVALTFLITLFTEKQFVVTQTKTICNSPQYIELEKKGIITCRFHKEFFAVWWYSSVDFRNSRPTLIYQHKNKSGPGFELGEFDVHPNGSLIVTEVKLKHEDVFTVAYLPSEEELYDFINIQVIVIVKPDVPFPLIAQCGNVSNTCFIVAGKGDMKCSVRGARPKVSLNFISRTVEGERNISEELVITPEGDGYTSRVSTSDIFHLSPLLVLLVCKASSMPNLFDKAESIALVQNGLVNRISEQSTAITIQRYDQMELNCTKNENAFIVWKKAIPPGYMDYELLLYSVNLGEGFIEVFAEDIILEDNASLVIPSTDIKHEGEYFCFFGDGLSDGIRVYSVTVAVLAYPVIDGCDDQADCKLQSEYVGRLTCSVERIRPQVELQWKVYYENQSSLISFVNPQRMVKENRGLFNVTLIVQYRVSEQLPERLTIECRVVSTNDLLSNLAKKMDLLFSTGNTATTRQTHPPAAHGVPVWVLVMVILLFLIFGVIIVIVFIRKIQSNTGTRDFEEEAIMLAVPYVGKKDQFLKQLKDTYEDLYDGVKPIPYIKDKMYCVNNVFVDQCITFKGPKGTWIGLETYHNVFSDPRVKSKRLLLEGEPGYGKSTVSLQYAYDWCNSVHCSPLKDVEILLLLRLRQLGGVSTIYSAIKQFLLPKDSSLTEGDIETILHNSTPVVIIFDGFDEYPDQDSETSDVINIIARNMFQDSTVFLTTRSACLPQNYSPITKRLRLTGFSNKDRKYYIKKAVVDDDKIVKKIEGYLKTNPILSDLCQVPLLFVLFAHMTHENTQLRNLESATTFFRHTISCLHHHMKNKAQGGNVGKYDLLAHKHGGLNMVAFKALNEKSKGMVWSKEEMCKEIGQEHYDLYKGMGILVEEEVLHFTDEPLNSDYVQSSKEVRFNHKVFCEWYAAHNLTNDIRENSTLDLKECLRNLHPVDVQYLYRFSCGLNSDCAEKIIHYLTEIEGGDKFAMLCILEKTGNTDNMKETIRQLCSEGVIISAHDSLLLQRSSMQLLAISARKKIPVKLLQLHNCFKSVDICESVLNTSSGLALSTEIPVEKLGLRLFNKRMRDEEYIDILKFSSMCPSLRLLGLYGSPPPKSFMLDSTLSSLSSRNVKVKYYGPVLESKIFSQNLLTGQWERICGPAQCTNKDFKQMVECTNKDFKQMESDWKTVSDVDVEEFRRIIHGYRKKLSMTAAKGSAMSAIVDEDDNVVHGEDDTDIMALLRISKNREQNITKQANH